MGAAFNYARGVPVESRFWSKVDRRGDDECWNWLASVDTGGYGNFGVKRCEKFVMQRAHRVAWELVHGADSSAGFVVCHSCDNRRCVNPRHLFVGSQRDNVRDCIAKGRIGNRSGERNGRAKLDALQVMEIRSAKMPLLSLAKKYGVAKSTVADARSGKSWAFAA